MGRGRRVQIAVVLALLTVGIGNAVLHLAPITTYMFGGLVALATWFITGAINDRRA